MYFCLRLLPGSSDGFIPGNLMGSDSNDAFIFACVPIIIFYFSVWYRCHGFDRKRIGTLFTLFGVAIIFWNIYNQNATSLTIWADSYTKREAPQFTQKVLSKFGFLNTITNEKKEVPVLDYHFHAQVGADGKVVTAMGQDPYLHNIPKDEWPAEGKSLKLISTEIYQSINPFWIIVLTPIIVGFFGFMQVKGQGTVHAFEICLGNHHRRTFLTRHGHCRPVHQYL